MYILNKSCSLDSSLVDSFMEFIRAEYAPDFCQKHKASDYRCSKLLMPASEDGSEVIIVQFFIDYELKDKEEFLQENIESFSGILLSRFDGQILSFQTLMEVLPL